MACEVCNNTKKYLTLAGDYEACYKCSGNGQLDTDKIILDTLLDLREDREEILKLLNQLAKNEEYRILLYSLSLSSPLLMWAKDTNGVYTYANKALAQHLFGVDDPSYVVGKNDVEIATEAMKKYPKWTFGTICMGTDQMALEEDKPMKVHEWGVIKDNFEYVTAYKNTYKDRDGKVLGTCGIAIYETGKVNELVKIMEDSTDANTKIKLAKHLKKYGFGCDNTFSNENIEQLWSKGDSNA